MKKLLFIAVSSLLFTFFSCNKDDSGSNEVPSISITSNYSNRLVGEEFIFQVLDKNSMDVTSDAIIKVDGIVISQPNFSTYTVGDHTVSASYQNLVTNNITITATAPTAYSQKVLAEDYTGTWCGFCPRTKYGVEQAKVQNDRVISISIHNGDVFEFEDHQEIEDYFGIGGGFPKLKLNRINDWPAGGGYPHEHLNDAFILTGNNASLGLSIDSNLDNLNLGVDVRVGFKVNYTDPIALVVCLTEHGLTADQTNYYVTGNSYGYEFYNGTDPIIDLTYNDVLRTFLTPILGTSIGGTETVSNNVFEQHFELASPSSIINMNNVDIIAFVVNINTKEVINVQTAPINENKKFD